MSASQPSRTPSESPEVIALRKKARGEPLTDEEAALLASATRKPSGDPASALSQVQIEALLEARRLRECG